MRLRSLLYVPAHSERFIAKAHERGADAVILDLEDSVPELDKDRARDGLKDSVTAVGRSGAAVFVRVNSGARREPDARAAAAAGAIGIMVPKTQSAADLVALGTCLADAEAQSGRPPMAFIALIEDPAALLDARSIAAVDRVVATAFGSEDFATATGGEPTPEVLRFPKLMLHYAAKAEGKLSLGLLQSSADYTDLDAIRAAAAEARAHGFDGATCVHPAIVPVLNESFAPSEAERAWAERVLSAAVERDGAFAFEGRMVDLPVLARARRILAG